MYRRSPGRSPHLLLFFLLHRCGPMQIPSVSAQVLVVQYATNLAFSHSVFRFSRVIYVVDLKMLWVLCIQANTDFGESVVCSDCADDGHTPLALASTSPLYLTIHSPAFASSSRNRPLPAPGIADFVILTCFGLLLGYDFFWTCVSMPKVLSPGFHSGVHRSFLYFSCILFDQLEIQNEAFGPIIHTLLLLFLNDFKNMVSDMAGIIHYPIRE